MPCTASTASASELSDDLFEELVALEVAKQVTGCSTLDAPDGSDADTGVRSRLADLQDEARRDECLGLLRAAKQEFGEGGKFFRMLLADPFLN